MARKISIGAQEFGKVRKENYFYIDKSLFIKEWWESGDDVTLITRPRRFGKTLTMSMMDYFFSIQHKDDASYFDGLSIWKEKSYRDIQGTFSVINLSFAGVKQTEFRKAYGMICSILYELYGKYEEILTSETLSQTERDEYRKVQSILFREKEQKSGDYSDNVEIALHTLSALLNKYYGKKVLIFLDEYDTPMQESFLHGYWDEMVAFIRSMFNNTFKTNSYMDRAILTGITRISKESIFSDFNNLEIITTSTEKYETSFGFTEQEVFDAMDELGRVDKENVKRWYDGFVFGRVSDIYNPWSITKYLDSGKLDAYWTGTSSNGLVSSLLAMADKTIKMDFETLIQGGVIEAFFDEQISFDQLERKDSAIWSLLLSGGYLKMVDYESIADDCGKMVFEPKYRLSITNLETRYMFYHMTVDWFSKSETDYNDFILALLDNRIDEMNAYMNRVALNSFSMFDAGTKVSEKEPERFYHGFVLGLLVKLSDQYSIRSNRESGYGRYDILLLPKLGSGQKANSDMKGIIIEFKVRDSQKEKDMEETVQNALDQIEQKKYETELLEYGLSDHQIRKYGFAYQGKKVLIGTVKNKGKR